MKVIWLILGLFVKEIFFSVSVKALIPQTQFLMMNNQPVNGNQLTQEPTSPIAPNGEGVLSPNQALIIGRWRGYQETSEFTIYYGYEFRVNGVYVARHRVYQNEKTILDQYWQGKWNFDGKILNLEGSIINQKSEIFKYNFRLDMDNVLYFQDGNLPNSYLPGKMAKFGELIPNKE